MKPTRTAVTTVEGGGGMKGLLNTTSAADCVSNRSLRMTRVWNCSKKQVRLWSMQNDGADRGACEWSGVNADDINFVSDAGVPHRAHYGAASFC